MSKELPSPLINIIKDKDNYFRVSAEDGDKFLKYGKQLYGFIEAKRPVPEKLFEKFMNLFSPVKEEFEKGVNSKVNSILRILTDKYGQDKEYDFFYQNKKRNEQFDLSEMLFDAVRNSVRHFLINKPDKHEYILKVSYLTMQAYKFQCPLKIQEDYLIHYKLSAMSAYITALLGYHFKYVTEAIDNNTHPENKDLEHAVAHYTKKWEIKKKKRRK